MLFVQGCQSETDGASARPLFFLAASASGVTLDEGEGGGNPFASALIELLGSEELTVVELSSGLRDLTLLKSRQFQRPQVPPSEELVGWTLLPEPPGEERVALVVVFSDYSASQRLSSLPGAAYDAARVGCALLQSGFEARVVIDPDRRDLTAMLGSFSEVSRQVPDRRRVHHRPRRGGGWRDNLLPGDYPMSKGSSALPEPAVPLSELGSAIQSEHLNLVFYAGSRDDPFGDP